MDIRKKSQYVYFSETDKSIVERVRPVELPISPYQIIMYSEKGEQGKLMNVGFSEFVDIFGVPDKKSHITKKQQYELVKTGQKIYVINVSGVDESKVQSINYTVSGNSYTLDNTPVISTITKGTEFQIGDTEQSLLKITTKYFGTYVNNLKIKVKFREIPVGNSTLNNVLITVFKVVEENGKVIEKQLEEFSGFLDNLVDDNGNSLFIEDIQSKSKYIKVKVNVEQQSNFRFPTEKTFEISFVRKPSDSDFVKDKLMSNDEIKNLIALFDDDTDFKYFVEGGIRTLKEIDSTFDQAVIRSEMIKKCQELMQIYIQDFYKVNDLNTVKSELTSNSSYSQQFYPDVIKTMVYDDEIVKEPFPVSVEVQKLSHNIDETYGQFYPQSGMLQKIDQIDLTQKIRKSDRDELYASNINPITKMFNEGIFVWGNKTTYQVDSKLEQLHVRRLLNFMIVRPLKQRLLPYIFKPMSPQFISEISNIVSDLILYLKQRGQVDDMTYRLQTIGTEVMITLNIKPVNQIEYITINMVVLPSEGITIEG